MKKVFVTLLILIGVLGLGAFVFYKVYFPGFMAEVVTGKEIPPYIPRRMQNKIEAIRAPLNNGTSKFVKEIYKADIPMGKVIDVIDEIKEGEANALLQELNQTKPQTTNEVFNIIKKHLPENLDIEVFRKPFNEHFTMNTIRQAIAYANTNRKAKTLDFETTKAIVKQIVEEKEKAFRSHPR
jgi:hypothetical protein